MFLGYNTSKGAVIRMTHTLQKELEVDGLDDAIQIYALHPGGVFTAMGGGLSPSSLHSIPVRLMLIQYHTAETAPDVKEKYGITKEGAAFEDLFKDTPELCGQACASLASGKGKDLRVFYVDCRQDVGKLLEVGRKGLKSMGLNTLTVKFLDGYCNEP
jgi:NAD(P)-dependent dehydrogenase (short-subunit alcohol dehydrogenase family)